MKYILMPLLIFAAFVLQGCTTTQFNTPKETPVSEKAILFLNTVGSEMSGRSGLYLREINGEKTRSLSSFKVEFEPGKYRLKFASGGVAGFAGAIGSGMVGGQAAANVHIYGTNRSDGNPMEIEVTLKPGHLYVANQYYTDQEELAVALTEL